MGFIAGFERLNLFEQKPFHGNRPDKKKGKEWDTERSRKQVHLHHPTINGTVSGSIGGIGTINSVSGIINGGAFDSKRSNQDEQTKRDLPTKRQKIDNYFQCEQDRPHTPPHRIFSCGASSGVSVPSWIQQQHDNEGSNSQEFSDSEDHCSTYSTSDHDPQTTEHTYNEDAYIKSIQLSQENATVFEIGFLEVIGNAINIDITKLNEDTEKVLKCMQISLFYQRQHHLQREATEQQLNSLESYGIIVYQRTFTIYIMHRTNGGIYVVDKLTEFSIPNSKDQLYVLKEVIEKVYMFKSRVMDYYLAVQITPTTKTYICTKEFPVEASPSKTSRTSNSSNMQSEIDGPSKIDSLKQHIIELEAENNKIKAENVELRPEL
ncbi:hypothetical protein C1645_858971 [Glomus cerebriforme]|uniref:Uncharacterized protein n=1 Tax=Glomus cerebriforme TaxID=658196 RepID=A0A397SGB3_9GLOM|nr:hypothetical protein C1645_858971 [Glomus cerebriforme]